MMALRLALLVPLAQSAADGYAAGSWPYLSPTILHLGSCGASAWNFSRFGLLSPAAAHSSGTQVFTPNATGECCGYSAYCWDAAAPPKKQFSVDEQQFSGPTGLVYSMACAKPPPPPPRPRPRLRPRPPKSRLNGLRTLFNASAASAATPPPWNVLPPARG